MPSYLTTLRDELALIRARLPTADPEAVPVLRAWISEIQRDIVRYSAIGEDHHEISGAGGNCPEPERTEGTAPPEKRRNTDFDPFIHSVRQ